MARIGIIAGQGNLPLLLKSAHPDAFVAGLAGATVPEVEHWVEFEKLGHLFEALRTAGVQEVVFAGATQRPQFDPAKLDDVTRALLPRLMPAMSQGDDAVLRVVMDEFAAQGFTMRGAHEVLSHLTLVDGQVFGAAPNEGQHRDAKIGRDHLAHLSALDIGQGIVIENGLCLGVETLQGTDALLGFVGQTDHSLRRGAGVLIKMPKRDQDLRADMPVIGRATVEAAHRAGLSGIAVAAGAVMVLDQDWMQDALPNLGFTVFSVPHG